MSNNVPASSAIKEIPAFTRGGVLSISTSTPRPTPEVESIQSPTPRSAQPHPSAHRTFSGPAAIPSSSIQTSLDDAVSPVTPQSASATGPRKKSLRFEKIGNELKTSATSPAMGSPKRLEMANRRHSADPKINVHTECGRHSDDWLFGGWNISGNVKKIWDRKDSKS